MVEKPREGIYIRKEKGRIERKTVCTVYQEREGRGI